MPVWHVSIAKQTSHGPVRFMYLRPKAIRDAIEIARELLAGVGGKSLVFTTDPPGCAIHFQKPLTADEIKLLPDGWMDIPAIDERGPCKLLSIN
jgi:hypothetical protein